MLLTCNRDRSTTVQPRAGVRVSPAVREVEIFIQSSRAA
jgi:hypothetical protein